MLSRKMNTELNKQLNHEFDSAYTYLSISRYLSKKGFSRFKNIVLEHACKHSNRAKYIYDFIVNNFGKIEISVQDNSKSEWSDSTEILDTITTIKNLTSNKYNYMLDLSNEFEDKTTHNFLKVLNNSLYNENYKRTEEKTRF